MDLCEAAKPGGVGVDAGVGCGMEIAVTTSLVAAEDDYRVTARRDVVKEFLGLGKVVCASAEVAAEKRRRPGFRVR